MVAYTFHICGGENRNLFVVCDGRYYDTWQEAEAAAMREAIYAFGPRGWHYIDYYRPAEIGNTRISDGWPTSYLEFITRQANLDAW